MNLSAWAHQVGVSKYTALRWYHAGALPVAARRAGRLVVVEPGDALAEPGRAVVYARVWSAGQLAGLGRQVAGLTSWAIARGMAVGAVVTEVGSAMNGRRRELGRLVAGPAAAQIVVGHRDRLARFGAGHFQAALAAQQRQVIILGCGGVEDDLVRDMTEVLAWFCARLCGRRGTRNRALRAVSCAGSAAADGAGA